eukprot:UC4_evm2s378
MAETAGEVELPTKENETEPKSATNSTHIRKRKKKNDKCARVNKDARTGGLRKRPRVANDGGLVVLDDDGDKEEDVGSVLEQTKQLQQYRSGRSSSARGISTLGLATGRKLTREDEVVEDDKKWTLNAHMLRNEASEVADENDKDGDSLDPNVKFSGSAGDGFKIDDDAAMLEYIESEMMKGKEVVHVDTRSEYEKMEAQLYQLPQHLQIGLKKEDNTGIISNQMLTGIPEYNLGPDAKLDSIQETEEILQRARQHRK